MSTTPWIPEVRLYDDKTSYDVDPQNIPIKDLAQRTQSLYERLNALADKNAVIIESADVENGIDAGLIVYWDTADARFKPGTAVWAGTYGPNGELVIAEEGIAQGIVLEAPNGGIADVLLDGSVVLTDTQMLNLFGVAAPTPGMYYLSAVDQGKAVNVKPATPVPVVYYRGLNRITMMVGAPPEHNHIHKNYILEETWFDVADPRFANMEVPVGAMWGYDKVSDPYVDELFMSYPGDFVVTVDGIISNQFVANIDNVWFTQASDPNLLGELNMFVSVPYNYGQPIVRAIQTTGDDLSITGVNGVITIDHKPWLPQTPEYNAFAVASIDGRTQQITPVVSALYPQEYSGIRIYKNPTTGEHVIDSDASGLGDRYADTINMNNSMQTTDGPYVLLTFPEGRDSSMTGVLPCPQLNTAATGFHYELTVFAERAGIIGGTVGVPISFPAITVNMTYVEKAVEGVPIDISTALTLTDTIPAEDTVQGMKYFTLATAALSVETPGTVYVELSMLSDSINRSLYNFGVRIELVAD